MPIVSDSAGKVFIAGEYGVLAGGPAVIAAVGPRFTLTDEAGRGVALGDIHAASPVGKLLSSTSSVPAVSSMRFIDPHAGTGGFGASTAQFALAHAVLKPEASALEVWRRYRALHEGEVVPPSGVDLFAQVQGGLLHWQGDGRARPLRLHPGRDFEICIFAAGHQSGRKVATHEHLPRLREVQERRSPWLAELNSWVESLAHDIQGLDGARLGATLQSVGDLFRREGLELEVTSRDCAALGALPPVLGIKGAGALQADALVAVVERAGLPTLIDAAARRDLRYVGILRDDEPGMRIFKGMDKESGQ